MPDNVLLEAMIAAAIEAGQAECAIYTTAFEVRRKEDASPVTAADHAAEAIILKHLDRAAPGVPVVAEEEVAAGRIPEVGAEFFLVDPLDGTKEFIAKRGEFTVNIGLVRHGLPVLGVVFAPANEVLYTGDVPGARATRSHQKPDPSALAPRQSIRVRTPPAQGMTAVASRSHLNRETEEYLEHANVAERVSVGSSLKFCLVAAGIADLYPRLGPTMEWDTAAGHAVLAAAGGKVTTLEGAPLRYGKPGFRNPFFVASGAAAAQASSAGRPR